ncbi:MAG: cyanophycin synthetase [Flavisolibacter sp.]
MKILDTKVMRGPNYWSIKRKKLVQFTLDLEELETQPTNEIPGFYEGLQQTLPSLYDHRCSRGKSGGFFERVQEGTWMGHVVEHIALELQSLAGIKAGFGRTRGTGRTGVYHVAFEYDEEDAGIYAGHAAISLCEAIINSHHFDVDHAVAEIRQLWYRDKPGPSTAAILAAATARNIPVMRLDEGSLFQLGYGCRQKRIEATITAKTSTIAVDIAGDKSITKDFLKNAHFPTPEGDVVLSEGEMLQVIKSIGYPVVVKPLDGNHGNGATVNVVKEEEARRAFHRARKYSEKVLVEKFIAGDDYRILVIDHKFVAAALRSPASITGDGYHTIQELVHLVNKDPRRGVEHENMLTTIKMDDVTHEIIGKNNFTPDSILPKGQTLVLKPTANLSTGGTATDVTDRVHPDNRKMFERVSRIIGLDICGIDVIATSLDVPLKQNGGAIIEVNAAPGFRMHLEPTKGTPRNVAKPVIDMLFGDSNGHIPIVAVTGTNGKTTTTRLMAHMAKTAGLTTGYTTTDGIYIDNELVISGDCSGPRSAAHVLQDCCVEFAVLETARGGILRSGLGFDQCDCAIITNVGDDHIGLDGVDTREKLARVKSVVAEAVHENGYAVLNADDDLVYAMKDQVKCNIALFSLYSNNHRIEEHCAAGGVAAVVEDGYLLLRIANHFIPVEEVDKIPISFGGKADFNIANALAVSIAAWVCHFKASDIRKALNSFHMSADNTPGRLNMYQFSDYSVMVDYAHNPHGVRALGQFVRSLDVPHRVGIITGVGDRRDCDIEALGEEAARYFDEIIVRHDEDMRGRTEEEIDKLITAGIQRVDAHKPIRFCHHETEALQQAIRDHKPGALIVVLIEKVEAVTAFLRQKQFEEKQSLPQLKKAG